MIISEDLYIQPRQWEVIIVMDLYSAVYQNYMSPDAHPHLSLMPPFSGLFVLACSGQGLLG